MDHAVGLVMSYTTREKFVSMLRQLATIVERDAHDIIYFELEVSRDASEIHSYTGAREFIPGSETHVTLGFDLHTQEELPWNLKPSSKSLTT